MRGFGSFIAVVTLFVAVLALGRDYYEVTYEDGRGVHADFGKQPDRDEHRQVEPDPQPTLGVVRHRPARTAVPRETASEQPQIVPAPSETTAQPAESAVPTPTPEISEDTGGETATPAP
ncbi:hypothetical protein [Actinoplanes sp. NPDC048796]|uniref:hypothetical protein n=1 Tax=Actinoplanes sp. NPDC048796 TaxID=3155640 RepID=UPI0033FA9C0C